MHVDELQTPALLVDRGAFDRNVATMSSALPGDRLRPHVKAFKSTALARRLADAGHRAFCAATPREIIGMAHDNGYRVCTYTPNDPVRVAELGGWGVDTIITDAVDQIPPV